MRGFWFCRRAKREAGARIFMDTATELGHIGSPIIIGQEMHDKANDREEIERIYGPYRRFGVYDVRHDPIVENADKLEPEVLAR